jgi:EAL domain-containing protein (putative c-di-GMP-specific phosphodiesterase class I)
MPQESSRSQTPGADPAELKIDRSLTNGLPAHRLSIRACAEGVETAQVFSFLEKAGCDALQGMYIAKPVADIFRMVHSSPVWRAPAS